jgi:putative ABC transport system ATP-binding protein
MVFIENLKFRYPSSTSDVLDIPSFSLARGERLFLYGPSGCGKTTFLEILAGINIPTAGAVTIKGQSLMQLSAPERDQFRADHLGYIFQSFNLIPYLNVEENITLPLYLSPLKRKSVSIESEKSEAKTICDFLGISHLLKSPVTNLSVGQQQRVAAARAILGRPDLILADEPTSSLDFDHRERFIALLFELCKKQKTSLLFVSHDRSLEKLFDRSLNLKDLNRAALVQNEDSL